MSTTPPPATESRKTCDLCRKRKVKCIPAPPDYVTSKCKGCYDIDKECTYQYKPLRPGRRTTRQINERARQQDNNTQADHRPPSHGAYEPAPDPQPYTDTFTFPYHPPTYSNATAGPSSFPQQLLIDPALSLGDASETSALDGLLTLQSGNVEGGIYRAGETGVEAVGGGFGGGGIGDGEDDELQRMASIRFPGDFLVETNTAHTNRTLLQNTSSDPPAPFERYSHRSPSTALTYLQPPLPQIEDVLPYGSCTFFIQLYLTRLHAIIPVVHRPTFTQKMVARDDKVDERFRAMIFGLVTFAIVQTPKSKMTDQYSQQALEQIQARCHAANHAISQRYLNKPNLDMIVALVTHLASCYSLGKVDQAQICLAAATRMASILGLHKGPAQGSDDALDAELRRRIYWVLYTTDRTEAATGLPILMPDYEGVADHCLEIDDDFITSQGYLPQPSDRPSYMVGFVRLSRIFQLFSECLYRQRTHKNGASQAEVDADLRWIEEARMTTREIMNGLPDALKRPLDIENEEWRDMFGTQRANMMMTVVSLEFLLLDLKAILTNDPTVAEEREELAREAYLSLSEVPIDHMAGNGWSIRGKVLRVILALLARDFADDELSQNVRDWWEMLGRVQFVQMIPLDVDGLA